MTDVYVIGGGPAGLAAAIAARRRGFSVALADARRPPIDKACGEGLLPDGILAASQLGLDPREIDGYSVRGIRFQGDNACATAEFPHGPGLGVRRTALHSALVRLAEGAGVELQWGRPIGGLHEIEARWIVGADGAGSRARTWANLDQTRRDSRRFGFRLHFRVAPWSDYVEIHWGDGCQIYVTPVARDEVGIALISRDPKLRVEEALKRFPVLLSGLGSAVATSTERGAVTAMRRLERVTCGNVALVGDASGSVDAITAEGLSLGFRQALALADALEGGSLARYESAHRRLTRRPRLMGDFLLAMDRWPGVRRRSLPLLAAHPALFRWLLAVHVGSPVDGFARCQIPDSGVLRKLPQFPRRSD